MSLVVASLIDKKSADLREASYLTDHMGRILDLTAQYNDIRPEALSALERIYESAKFTQGPATGARCISRDAGSISG